MPATLTPDQLAHDLSIPDLSDPADGPHAMQQLVELAVTALAEPWPSGPAPSQVRLCRGPRVVLIADNYDRLGYHPDAVTRDARYTRYTDEQHMLRSHSTALIPAALRRLAADQSLAADHQADMLLACPGIAYRRDAIDWQHTGTPHQLDLWRISRGRLSEAELAEMIDLLLSALAPGRPTRKTARQHPYTLAGRQVDVARSTADDSADRDESDWVEVWECGIAHPDVLAAAGLHGCTGLALGMGLDRLLMLRKGIGDIRLLRSADPRVASQLQDLAPYRPVSAQPAVRRDMSVAVDGGEDAETLGDRVRDALGPDADAVEQVSVLSDTPCRQLPDAALARLGARPEQRNLLIRVVLRRLDRTMTDAEANELRDRVYAALHQGESHQWAASTARGDDPPGSPRVIPA
jgi:phenylalanyl-tRNA synthetase alpha chain